MSTKPKEKFEYTFPESEVAFSHKYKWMTKEYIITGVVELIGLFGIYCLVTGFAPLRDSIILTVVGQGGAMALVWLGTFRKRKSRLVAKYDAETGFIQIRGWEWKGDDNEGHITGISSVTLKEKRPFNQIMTKHENDARFVYIPVRLAAAPGLWEILEDSYSKIEDTLPEKNRKEFESFKADVEKFRAHPI